MSKLGTNLQAKWTVQQKFDLIHRLIVPELLREPEPDSLLASPILAQMLRDVLL